MSVAGAVSSPARVLRRLLDRAGGIWDGTSPSVAAADAARVVVRAATLVAVVGALVQGAVHLVNVVGLDGRARMFNADLDEGAFTWASAAATSAAAFGCALIAALVPARRVLVLALAAVLTLFSLDDAVALHERISVGAIGPIEHAGRLLWPLVTMPLLGFALVLLTGVAARAPEHLRRAMRAALAMLVAAIALELGSPALFELGSDHGELLYELEVAIEEGLELAGWALVAGALGGGVILVASRDEATQ